MCPDCPPSMKLLFSGLHSSRSELKKAQELLWVQTKLHYLRQYLVAGLQQRPCGSSVPRALRSDVGSSVESPGLEDPDRHAPHQENHLPWGRERSGLRGGEGRWWDRKLDYDI